MANNIREALRNLTIAGSLVVGGGAGGVAADRILFNGQGVQAGTSSEGTNLGSKQLNTIVGNGETNLGAQQGLELSPAPSLLEGITEPTFLNVPETAENVELASGMFENTIGHGSRAFLAEPGGLWVGPEFSQRQIDAAGGNIQRINPGNQELLETLGPSFHTIPEGGWLHASLGGGVIKIGEAVFLLPFQEGHNYLFYVRGRYGDQEQDTDRNMTAEFSEYAAGHALVQHLNAAEDGSVAFLSEGQFRQVSGLSEDNASNCGDNGCSTWTAIYYDTNTQALVVMNQSANGELTGETNFR